MFAIVKTLKRKQRERRLCDWTAVSSTLARHSLREGLCVVAPEIIVTSIRAYPLWTCTRFPLEGRWKGWDVGRRRAFRFSVARLSTSAAFIRIYRRTLLMAAKCTLAEDVIYSRNLKLPTGMAETGCNRQVLVHSWLQTSMLGFVQEVPRKTRIWNIWRKGFNCEIAKK